MTVKTIKCWGLRAGSPVYCSNSLNFRFIFRSGAISRLIAESPAPSAPLDETLYLTPDVTKSTNNSKRPPNGGASFAYIPAKSRKIVDRAKNQKENWPSSEPDFPSVKIIDTTNSNLAREHAVDSIYNSSFLPSSLPSLLPSSLARRQRNAIGLPKRGQVKARPKPFTSKPAMSSSLRPTLNLVKSYPR